MPEPPEPRHPRPVKRRPTAPLRPGLAPAEPPRLAKRIPPPPAIPLDRSHVLVAALGLGLAAGWIGQFATPLFDRHPGWGIAVALTNAGLAVATALLGRGPLFGQQEIPRKAVIGLSGLVIAGALFVTVGKLGYSGTLGGFEGYALPRHAIDYGPEAREVTLTASDRTRLKATYLGRRAGDRASGKALLVVPGWLSRRESFGVATLALWFHPEYDVLVLDPRGQGDSAGAQHPDGRARFDILAGVAYLKAQGNARVGVLAEREGAYAAVLAAAEGGQQPGHSRVVDSLFLAAPVAQWGEPSLGGGFWRDPSNPIGRVTWRITAGIRLKGGTSRPLAEVLPGVAGTPVMLTGPQEDPEGIVRQLHLVAPEPRSLQVFAGKGVPVPWKSYHRYYESARQFFNLTLRAEPAAPAEGSLPPELLQAIEDVRAGE